MKRVESGPDALVGEKLERKKKTNYKRTNIHMQSLNQQAYFKNKKFKRGGGGYKKR